MKKQKSLAYDSAKKKKILLGTLIPLGCLVAATAIIVPVVLTQCKNETLTFDKIADHKFLEPHSSMTIGGLSDSGEVVSGVSNLFSTKASVKEAILVYMYSVIFGRSNLDNWKADWKSMESTFELHASSLTSFEYKVEVPNQGKLGFRTTNGSIVKKASISTDGTILQIRISYLEIWNGTIWEPLTQNAGIQALLSLPYLKNVTFNITEN